MQEASEGSGAGEVVAIDALHPEAQILDRAARIIRGGGLVAFPTETVYGVGANALDPRAVEGIFRAKQRPHTNPLIVHVSSAAAARELVTEWPAGAERLTAEFWPGPLTLVLPKRELIGDRVTAGLPTVAIRVPAHPVAQGLLTAAGTPIAAPSANPFMRISPTTAEHVRRGLGERVDLILDAGPTTVGIESTVVDLSRSTPMLLRAGTIPVDRIATLLGTDLESGASRPAGEAMPSPGMLERHYSPRARLLLVASGDDDELKNRVEERANAGDRIGAMLIRLPSVPGIQEVIRLDPEPAAYARGLYANLHLLDDAGVDVILVERPPPGPEWAGVLDRLRRASESGTVSA